MEFIQENEVTVSNLLCVCFETLCTNVFREHFIFRYKILIQLAMKLFSGVEVKLQAFWSSRDDHCAIWEDFPAYNQLKSRNFELINVIILGH